MKRSSVTLPRRGRSGGGLYTPPTATSLASAISRSPQGNHGLYASPTSIHGIPGDKNGLASLYSGDRSGTLIAAASIPSPGRVLGFAD